MLPQHGEPTDAAQDARVSTLPLGYFWVAPPRAHPRRPGSSSPASTHGGGSCVELPSCASAMAVSSSSVRARGGGSSVKLPYAHTRDGRRLGSSSFSIPAMPRLSSPLLPILAVCEGGRHGGVRLFRAGSRRASAKATSMQQGEKNPVLQKRRVSSSVPYPLRNDSGSCAPAGVGIERTVAGGGGAR
jgi:hypothetical protein